MVLARRMQERALEEVMAQPQAINWNDSVDEAVERARKEQRTVLVDFTAAPM
jgi:hypothetical protein